MSMLNLKLALALCMAMAEPQHGLTPEKKDLACKLAYEIVQESARTEISPALVAAVITVESSWRPSVESSAGACGLTQVVPKWTGKMTGDRRYTCSELKQPRHSVYAGIAALGYWRKRYRRNTRLALCGYNAGNTCSEQSTRLHAGIRYSDKVLRYKSSISSSMDGYMLLLDAPRRAFAFLMGFPAEAGPVRKVEPKR